MNRPFLLIAKGKNEALSGVGNWIGFFSSIEQIERKITKKWRGPPWGGHNYFIDGVCYDGYEIIDVRKWLGDDDSYSGS